MDTSIEQKVRERAYEIWLEAGRQDGMAHEHWRAAEADVKTSAVSARAPAAKAAVKPRVKLAKAPAVKKAAKAAPRAAKGLSASAHLN